MRLSRRGLFSAIVATGIAGFGLAAGADDDTIKIGDINSYKRLPAHTVPYRQGAELAINDINAKGGVMGKKLELVSRDDDGQPGEAVKIAEELFSKDNVALVSGSLFSHVGLALTAFAGQNKKLYVRKLVNILSNGCYPPYINMMT